MKVFLNKDQRLINKDQRLINKDQNLIESMKGVITTGLLELQVLKVPYS